jgi:hypothetical protein
MGAWSSEAYLLLRDENSNRQSKCFEIRGLKSPKSTVITEGQFEDKSRHNNWVPIKALTRLTRSPRLRLMSSHEENAVFCREFLESRHGRATSAA